MLDAMTDGQDCMCINWYAVDPTEVYSCCVHTTGKDPGLNP